MSTPIYPLTRMMIRRNAPNNTFGMVRNQHQRAHQGWDLLAARSTSCYAIADGVIRQKTDQGDYGLVLLLEFEHRGRRLYAFYAHLSTAFGMREDKVRRGDVIALTGNSGNASNLSGEDLHLHFEIRTWRKPGVGLAGRINPAEVFGTTPVSGPLFSSQATPSEMAGIAGGLKVKTGF